MSNFEVSQPETWSYRDLKRLIQTGSVKDVIKYLRDKSITPGIFKQSTDRFMQRMNPISLAAQYGRAELLDALVASGFPSDMVSGDDLGLKLRPIHLACHGGHIEVVKSLVETHAVDLSSRDRFDNTPLYWQIQNPVVDVDLVRYLLEAGAPANVQNKFDKLSPLHIAVRSHENPELCELLLKHGADVEARDSRGLTPLHYAASEGHNASARTLCAAGADLEARCRQDTTPLLAAAKYNKWQMMKYLIAKGSNPFAQDNDMNTVMHYAVIARATDIVRYLVVDLNIDANFVNKNNMTPFCLAIQICNLDIAKVLASGGFQPRNVFDGRGRLRMSFPEHLQDDDVKVMKEFLSTMLHHPNRLQDSCVFKIRRLMGRTVQNKVDSLQLPCVVADIVKLKHV